MGLSNESRLENGEPMSGAIDAHVDVVPSILRDKPWTRTTAPAEVLQRKGMIGPAERACYYWFGRYWFSGDGAIVDAGAFVGASTAAFAAGAAASAKTAGASKPYVHAYDYFEVIDEYVGAAISRDFGPIKAGQSYRSHFEAQVAPFADVIRSYPGDFKSHTWNGTPIEILFIDIAKTKELNEHLLKEFFPSLVPGKSIVIHQDYYHCWHPYIHYSMEFLCDEFALIDDYVPYQSRVWLLTKAIPRHKLDELSAGLLAADARIRLLERLADRSSAFMKPMIEVVTVWELCQQRRYPEALGRLDCVGDEAALAQRPELWARQALQIRRHLNKVLRP
jgi:hypothetical protein